MPTLLVPGNFSQSHKVILDKIGVEVAKKYSVLFANSTIVYASRSGSNYTLMYNTSAGYIRVDAIYDVFGTVVVGKASESLLIRLQIYQTVRSLVLVVSV